MPDPFPTPFGLISAPFPQRGCGWVRRPQTQPRWGPVGVGWPRRDDWTQLPRITGPFQNPIDIPLITARLSRPGRIKVKHFVRSGNLAGTIRQMSTIPDAELLRRYAEEREEGAFSEIVGRHVNHVYSAALRLVGGDSHLAQDVTQIVFTDLARKAGQLEGLHVLSSWLHTSARFAAAKLVRSEQRRRLREQATLPMNMTSGETDPAWDQARPVLDETIGELEPADRDALMLRYFEKKPLAHVGAALGLSENAARMRVDRATEKLRTRLAVRGITSAASALGASLAQFTVGTAPPNLQAQIVSHALATGTSVGAPASRSLVTTGKLAIAGVLIAAVLLGFALKRNPASQASDEAAVVGSTSSETGGRQPSVASANRSGPVRKVPLSQPGPELFFLDDQTRRAITNRAIGLKGWERGAHSLVEKTVQLQEGRCVAPFFLMESRDYLILTHIDGYADVRLRWNVSPGEALPESHTVRLVRPALIGGRVESPTGQPVAGATVGFNSENIAADAPFTEDHCVDYLTVETDSNGQWQLQRLAPEMVGRIFGSASHPDYSPSEMMWSSRKPELVTQLLNRTFVLRLGEGIVVTGSVQDGNGQAIANANVMVGRPGSSSTRDAQTESDGSFRISGCTAGEGVITAEAKGYAPAALSSKVAAGMPAAKLVLNEGKVLSLQVLDKTGAPVPNARVILQSFPYFDRPDPVPQVSFGAKADAEGWITWPHAPAQRLTFNFSAPGFMQRDALLHPDGEVHVITLDRALVIVGAVQDAVTGEAVPDFRLGIGWPERQPNGSFKPQWSTSDRFWKTFKGSEFRYVLEEPVVGGQANPAFVFRFEAEGHATFVTRAYQSEEGEVQLEIKLQPANDIRAIAYTADGKVAPNVQVGLMFPGTDAHLVPGGFAGELGQALAWVRRTDAQGWFVVPGAEPIQSVIVADANGYAEATPDNLRKLRTIRLQPWARIEGNLPRDLGELSNVKLGLRCDNPSALPSEGFEATSDDHGDFVFEKVPAGNYSIFAIDSGPSKPIGTVEARAGETNQVLVTNGLPSLER